MKTVLLALMRTAIVGLSAVAFLLASHASARADEVTLTGFTTGSHNVPSLFFVGNRSFTGTTALGVGSLSGVNHLGEFQLGPGPLQLVSGEFRLDITFTSPTGIAGGQNTTYTATVFGSVAPALNFAEGGVHVHFLNPTQTFTFNDGLNSGSFSLTLADVYVQSRWEAKLTAGFTGQQNSAVPEPATLLLLGTGIAGVAAKLRQRKRNAAAANAQ